MFGVAAATVFGVAAVFGVVVVSTSFPEPPQAASVRASDDKVSNRAALFRFKSV